MSNEAQWRKVQTVDSISAHQVPVTQQGFIHRAVLGKCGLDVVHDDVWLREVWRISHDAVREELVEGPKLLRALQIGPGFTARQCVRRI